MKTEFEDVVIWVVGYQGTITHMNVCWRATKEEAERVAAELDERLASKPGGLMPGCKHYVQPLRRNVRFKESK